MMPSVQSKKHMTMSSRSKRNNQINTEWKEISELIVNNPS